MLFFIMFVITQGHQKYSDLSEELANIVDRYCRSASTSSPKCFVKVSDLLSTPPPV